MRHAPLAAELVDEDFVAGMAFDIFKQQGRTAGLGDAVGNLGDFQLRRNLFADALEFAGFSSVLIQSRKSS